MGDFDVEVVMTRGTSSDDKERIEAAVEADDVDELDERMTEVPRCTTATGSATGPRTSGAASRTAAGSIPIGRPRGSHVVSDDLEPLDPRSALRFYIDQRRSELSDETIKSHRTGSRSSSSGATSSSSATTWGSTTTRARTTWCCCSCGASVAEPVASGRSTSTTTAGGRC
jgi:hypothetical protein